MDIHSTVPGIEGVTGAESGDSGAATDSVGAGSQDRLLWPTSTIAKAELCTILEARGHLVTRLDVYDTIPATWSADETLAARGCTVAAFASPSAVDGWVREALNNRLDTGIVTAVCIGETTAAAARRASKCFSNVTVAETPSIVALAHAVVHAIRE